MNAIHWYDFNWFDIAIIIVVALSMFVSFFRGFIREAVSLITWIVALILALKFASLLGDQFVSFISSPSLRYTIAFLIIFLVVLLLGSFLNMLIRYLVDKTGIGFFDRLLGVIFGTARGILLVAVVIMLLQVSGLKDEKWLKESQLTDRLQPLITWLSSYVPQQIENVSKWINNKSLT